MHGDVKRISSMQRQKPLGTACLKIFSDQRFIAIDVITVVNSCLVALHAVPHRPATLAPEYCCSSTIYYYMFAMRHTTGDSAEL